MSFGKELVVSVFVCFRMVSPIYGPFLGGFGWLSCSNDRKGARKSVISFIMMRASSFAIHLRKVRSVGFFLCFS